MPAIASFVAFTSLLNYGLPQPTPPRNPQRCSLDDNAIGFLDLANRIIIITGDELE